jgi:hypothetical protein
MMQVDKLLYEVQNPFTLPFFNPPATNCALQIAYPGKYGYFRLR